MTVRKITNQFFGELTIIINEDFCWFVLKELLASLRIKIKLDFIDKNVSSKNILKLDYKSNKLNDDYSILWKNKNDHSNKILINKFGVIQLLSCLKLNNSNDIINNFICMTFRKSILSSVQSQQSNKNYISEIDKLRLKLFSDNKLEVIKAHKELIKLELENNKNTNIKQNESKQLTLFNHEDVMQSNNKDLCMYNKIVEELNNAKKEIDFLKNQVGRGSSWSTVGFRKKEWKSKFGHFPDWKELCRLSKQLGILPIKDCIEKDKNGVERKVNRYHNDVWDMYEEEERRKQ